MADLQNIFEVKSMLLAPQHAVSLCKSVGSPARWAANEKVLPSLHAGPTVSFYYWDLIFCVRYSVASPPWSHLAQHRFISFG